MAKTLTENADPPKAREPQHIVNMIDNEGWPDALDWLVRNDFGDETLNDLVKRAKDAKDTLDAFENQIKERVETLGGDWYLA